MNTNNDDDKICCPKFNPEPWNETCFTWDQKPFLRDTIPQFLHIPLPGTYSKAIKRMWKKAEVLGVAPEPEAFMVMAFDPSPWKSELYMSISEKVDCDGAIELTGTFVSKVFDGPYSDIPKYMKEIDRYLERIEKKAIKVYFYYTTCPACAKKYGHNYIVAIVEVD